jgi:competence protein ComGC
MLSIFSSFRNQRGVSLVETMAVIVIISFSIIGLVSSFIYGRFNVERTGLERKALEALEGRMEYWKNARFLKDENLPLSTHLGAEGEKAFILDRDKEVRAVLRTDISGVRRDAELSYQQVTVTLKYDNGPFKDSLGLTTKMYLRQ